MADTAQVLIQIRGDVGDINAKLADLKGNIGKINKDLEGLGKLGKFSFAAVSAGVASVIYVAKEAINTIRELADIPLELAEAYGKQEEAEAKLTATLAAHGVTSKEVTRAYADMAAEIQRTTKYSDDMVISAQAILTSMGVMPTQMQGAIQATTVLATRTGSLESAAQALGQALNGNYRGLRQIVPALKGAEEGAFSASQIFSMIRETLGDQAQAEAEGYIGKVQKLKNAWDDLKETIGEEIIPLITELIEKTVEGIHTLETLFGVQTVAWKKKELELLEQRIRDADKELAEYESRASEDKVFGITGPAVGGEGLAEMRARAQLLREQIAAADELNRKTLEQADKSFKSPQSHLYDELMRQWALTREKLAGEIETAGLDSYQHALVKIEASAAKLRDQFSKIKEAKPLIDAWEAAMKYEAEMENLLRIGEREQALEDRIKQNREQQLDLLLEMSRLETRRADDALKARRADLEISEADYLRGQIKITEDLIRLEKQRQDQIDTTDEQNMAAWLRHETAIDSYKSKLDDLMRSYRDAAAGLSEGMIRGLKEYADTSANAFKDSVETAKRAFSEMENALVEMVQTGKLNFRDMVDSILADLARIAIRQSITAPLASGLGGILGDLLPSFNYHSGGVVGSEGGRRFVVGVNPEALPRYHGGVGPGEQLAVLQKGEAVFTPGQLKALGQAVGGGVNVSITNINKAGVDIQTNVKETEQGLEIEQVIDQAVAKKLGQFGSSSNRALKQTYGARERLVSR